MLHLDPALSTILGCIFILISCVFGYFFGRWNGNKAGQRAGRKALAKELREHKFLPQRHTIELLTNQAEMIDRFGDKLIEIQQRNHRSSQDGEDQQSEAACKVAFEIERDYFYKTAKLAVEVGVLQTMPKSFKEFRQPKEKCA